MIEKYDNVDTSGDKNCNAKQCPHVEAFRSGVRNNLEHLIVQSLQQINRISFRKFPQISEKISYFTALKSI